MKTWAVVLLVGFVFTANPLMGQVLSPRHWTAATLRYQPTNQWELSASYEFRNTPGFVSSDFVDLGVKYNLPHKFHTFYEYRWHGDSSTARHTAGVGYTHKLKIRGWKGPTLKYSTRYHSTSGTLRNGLKVERKWNQWTPSLKLEQWNKVGDTWDLSRYRTTLETQWAPSKLWDATLGYGYQWDFRADHSLKHRFPIFLLSVRYSIKRTP